MCVVECRLFCIYLSVDKIKKNKKKNRIKLYHSSMLDGKYQQNIFLTFFVLFSIQMCSYSIVILLSVVDVGSTR